MAEEIVKVAASSKQKSKKKQSKTKVRKSSKMKGLENASARKFQTCPAINNDSATSSVKI